MESENAFGFDADLVLREVPGTTPQPGRRAGRRGEERDGFSVPLRSHAPESIQLNRAGDQPFATAGTVGEFVGTPR
jgi:hypothetical protein